MSKYTHSTNSLAFFFGMGSYIFGNNSGGRVAEDGEIEPEKVAMTAPVRTEQSQKVAMTSPVRTELWGNLRRMKVSFVMPRKVWSMGEAGLRAGAATGFIFGGIVVRPFARRLGDIVILSFSCVPLRALPPGVYCRAVDENTST